MVAADALLAAGDPQGELMNVQCELEAGGFTRERGIALRRREVELLLASPKAGDLGEDPVFRRGLVDEIAIDVKLFAQREEEVFRRWPALRFVNFTGLDGWGEFDQFDPTRLENALASGRVTAFGALDARTGWMAEGAFVDHYEERSFVPSLVEWLVTSGHLAKLRGLGLRHMEPDVVAMLGAHAKHLDDLRLEGDLENASFGETEIRPERLVLLDSWHSVARVLAAPLASRVRDLHVYAGPGWLDSIPASVRVLRGKVDDRAERPLFEKLAAASTLSGVEDLTIAGHIAFSLPRPDPSALFDSPHLSSLRTLRITSTLLSPEGARALVESPLAQRLELIDLRPCRPNILVALEGHHWDGALFL
jgi:hypothetical protein